MTNDQTFVIVGAGLAGAKAAETLRAEGFGGRLLLIGSEAQRPYERPPLSKEYLCGDKPFERMLIRPAEFWPEQRIQTIVGRTVISVQPDAHRVTLADGERIGYGRLVWAAGGSPRQLTCPGADLIGMHTVRTKADVERIRGIHHRAAGRDLHLPAVDFEVQHRGNVQT